MRVLFVSGRPHFPQAFGGVPRSTHDLAMTLRDQGHHVAVLSGFADRGRGAFYLRALRKLFGADRVCGYPVHREWFVIKAMKQVVDIEKPDIAIVQIGNSIGLAQALEARGVPVLFYLHNVDINDLGGDPRALSHARFIANSRFTAERYRSVFGIDSAVIPPLVRAEDYRTRRGRANVTMINPHPVKGQEVMLKVARACPDIAFHLVESWPLHSEEAESLVRAIARLPNVRFTRRTSDMKSIYGAAKFLLAPSICEEAWGRVATEAHFSGIPVIASNRGGLPESVGPGGVLLDPEGGIEPWIDAVRKMWTDKVFYERMSEAALAYSRRPEIQPEHLAAALIEEGRALVRRAASRRREEVSA